MRVSDVPKGNFYETVEGHRILDERNWSPRLKEYLKLEDEFLLKSIKQNSKLLDVGCGEGRHLSLLSDRCSKLIGIDNSETMAGYSKKTLARQPHVSVIHRGIADFESPTKFDNIICMFNTFGNIDFSTQITLLKKVEHLLKKDGVFLLSVYSEAAKDTQIQFYKRIGLKVNGSDENFVYTDGLISERFTRKKIKELVTANSRLKIRKIFRLNQISYLAELTL